MLKELEKENERKEKENKHVVGEEAMKTAKKTKEKWFGKRNRKEDEACGKEKENKGELREW